MRRKKLGDRELSDVGKNFVKGIPMGELVKLADMDGPLLLLCSGASRKMTGSVLTVDGGHVNSSL